MVTDVSSLIDSDPERLDGELCFTGTRVPVRNLFDYLAAGQPLEEFLDDFPRVSADNAVAVLHGAYELLESQARQRAQPLLQQSKGAIRGRWLVRIVLNECLPRRLARLLPTHDVYTVQELHATSIKNGALLALLAGQCDLFVTVDRGIRYQQQLDRHPFAIALLQAPSNRLADLVPLIPALEAALPSLQPGEVLVFGARLGPQRQH
jgi:uncharacterized protein (DUF433 family)